MQEIPGATRYNRDGRQRRPACQIRRRPSKTNMQQIKPTQFGGVQNIFTAPVKIKWKIKKINEA